MRLVCTLSLLISLATSCFAQSPASNSKQENRKAMPDEAELQKMSARFVPTEIKVDLSALSAGDRKALVKLVEAAQVIDDIFLNQYWSGNADLWKKLQKETTPLGKAQARYFWLNKGPWSVLDDNAAFLPGVPDRKPLGANFYPQDMTREEFESWLNRLPAKDKEAATGFFTVIRRLSEVAPNLKHGLRIVPYKAEYKADLNRASALLKEAAALTDNPSLKKFLNSRAEAFQSNDYFQSDVDWMDLDAPIDVTIGPYETYNDEIFGYKASFEAYINLRDDAETQKLSAFSQHLQEIENNLPIDAQYRNPKIGAQAPIRVVNELFSSGDGNHGIQTAAYNLPNDERVIAQKGSKRVMLKNVQEAKFRSILIPISKTVLAEDDQKYVEFDSFFTHILAHELCHGLGPHNITVNGRQTTAREELKDLYSAIEEAKADITGLFALQYMYEHAKEMGLDSVLKNDADSTRRLYTTYLASTFRTLRFGPSSAHGKGMVLQVNYLLDKGGLTVRPDGTFAVDFAKIKDAARQLTHDILMLEATGDYAGAKKLLDQYSKVSPEFQRAIDRMSAIPIDIEPVFVTAKEITGTK